ncbi:MAG: hypothetical protein HY754_03715 [Nitrospirae bacterium]|nr:hypothetical protein [Nitrospirota bacterium]
MKDFIVKNFAVCVFFILFYTLYVMPEPVAYAGVAETRHNLSVGGPGQIKAKSETEICIFCHTPHHSSTEGPLWNRSLSKVTYIVGSPTGSQLTRPEQPDGSSKLCLSCHDGTVAIGAVINAPRKKEITMTDTAGYLTAGMLSSKAQGYIGVDISQHHPVSIPLNDALISAKTTQYNNREIAYPVKSPPPDSPVKLRATKNVYGGQAGSKGVQCSSCHNPHDDTIKCFLVAGTCSTCPCPSGEDRGELCNACHYTGDAGSKDRPHLDKSKVKGGCSACHTVHSKKARVLNDRPEELCLKCHGPSGGPDERAQSNIFSLITKRSVHPVLETSKYHMANEELPERDSSVPRHVSCLDCHNVHMVKPGERLAWIKGTDVGGIKKKTAEKESEVCYNCHSDSINLPSNSYNIRLEFNPANESYHPVERVSKGRSQSLLKNIAQGSLITCSSCHEPHGSDYSPLLRVNYNMEDGVESTYAYELCYGCHDRDSILSNRSFKGSPSKDYGHKEHITYQKASCFTCHASHGSDINPNLINFNPSVVTGARQYLDYQGGRAQCNLTCHGKVHK